MTPGAIVQTGNWGRILNAYNMQGFGNAWLLAREMTYEAVRAAKYPDKPSRLSCAFAFESIDGANQKRGDYQRWSSLYEVELVTPDAPSHRAPYNLVQFPAATTEFLPAVVQSADAYWRGEDVQIAELLTKSALRIRQVIATGPATYQP